MLQSFSRSGIQIGYPRNWQSEWTEQEHGWTLAFHVSDTAFAFLTLDESVVAPALMVDQSHDAMAEEYKQMESEDILENHLGRPVFGHSIDFITLDLVNWCGIRSMAAPVGSILLFGQCSDAERNTFENQLLQVWRSMQFAEEDD